MGKGGVMSLAVVGAGLGRTGTSSLKVALERLLECPCYHMVETFDRPIHLDAWRRAALGEPVDWRAVLDGFGAAVDWPAAAFWRELASEHPGALVLLSTREPAATWWTSSAAADDGWRLWPAAGCVRRAWPSANGAGPRSQVR
jgi:hypothetical protein